MEDYRQKYYNLYQFLGGYFHQDWQYDYDWKGEQPDTEKVVRHYKSIAGKNTLEKVASEMKSLLSENLSETELRNVLIELNSAHRAPATHKTYRKWLERILEILEEPMEKTKSELTLQRNPDAGWRDDGWMDYVDAETKRMLNLK